LTVPILWPNNNSMSWFKATRLQNNDSGS
jgi:hypothetical protein